MIARSSASSSPGLLMISSGIRILPTSCSSAANSASRRPRARGRARRRRRSTRSTTSRLWLAGVRVVGLDDVAEQERGAAVRGAKARGRGRSARAAPGRTRASRPSSGSGTSERPRHRIGRRERDQQPHRGQRKVDEEDPPSKLMISAAHARPQTQPVLSRGRRSRSPTGRRAQRRRQAAPRVAASAREPEHERGAEACHERVASAGHGPLDPVVRRGRCPAAT